MSANPHRGEASLNVGGETIVLRPTFGALVAAEEELGPLFALVERAAEGRMSLSEMAALFDRMAVDRPAGITRERIGEALRITDGAVLAGELAAADPAAAVRLRSLFSSFGSTAAATHGAELARLGLL